MEYQTYRITIKADPERPEHIRSATLISDDGRALFVSTAGYIEEALREIGSFLAEEQDRGGGRLP